MFKLMEMTPVPTWYLLKAVLSLQRGEAKFPASFAILRAEKNALFLQRFVELEDVFFLI